MIAIEYFFAVIIVVAVILVFAWISRSKKKQPSNVIPLHKRRGVKAGILQECSRCKKRLPLTFYANDAGTVRGLCKACAKQIGKREELYPV
ncbi:hypothetical protein ACK8P5_06255 [Paenibacillus sp. EC2-1]|uniref:hypothetical protein n=1 Tax=Paenibacillus sp. EC2-1 TaxID=3388665 RepID=UPI003BEF2FA8